MSRIVADQAGHRMALIEPGRVVVLELPSLAPAAEVGIAGDLADHDVRFVGEAGRLAVLTRVAGRAVMHVVNPAGPTKLGEVQFRTTARLLATAGNYALTVAGNVAAVTDLSQPALVAIPLPTRGTITAAAPIGPTRFAVAIGGAIEEWDGSTRTPGRRLRVERPLDPIALGGNAQRLFVVTRDTPHLVDVITFSTRSTKKLALPEPATRVAAHPGGDLIAFIGGTTKNAYLLDLIRGTPVRLDRGEVEDLAWVGDGHALAIKPEASGIELVSVETTSESGRRWDRNAAPLEPIPTEASEPVAVPDDSEADGDGNPEAGTGTGMGTGTGPEGAITKLGTPGQWSRNEITHRLAAWRSRFSANDAAAATAAKLPPSFADREDEPTQVLPPEETDEATPGPAAGSTPVPHRVVAPDPFADRDLPDAPPAPPTAASTGAASPGGWRADLAAWARAVDAGSVRSAPTEPRPPLDAIAHRLGLSADLATAIALLYGAHLAGLHGVAPLELASVAGWHWEEALGAGTLAAAGIARWAGSRIRLAEETLAAIDGRPPRFGTRVGTHDAAGEVAASREAVALIAPPSVTLGAVGAWAAPALGALLVPNARGERAPERFILEARLRGLAPLVPWDRFRATLADPPHPSAIVVDTAATAAHLELPVVATWGASSERDDASIA